MKFPTAAAVLQVLGLAEWFHSPSEPRGVLRVAWSTEKGISLGPDGPWQAIELSVGSVSIVYCPLSGGTNYQAAR